MTLLSGSQSLGPSEVKHPEFQGVCLQSFIQRPGICLLALERKNVVRSCQKRSFRSGGGVKRKSMALFRTQYETCFTSLEQIIAEGRP